MGTYRGTITTTGKAIRLEKAQFKSHPEFRQKSKVHAHVNVHAHIIAPGTMLVSVAGEAPAQTEADPIMAAFLSFLSADILRSPDGVKPLARRE
jgi:antitoxin PrlF